MAAFSQTSIDRIFAILADRDTGETSLVQVDTDGVSIASMATLYQIPGIASPLSAHNGLAYAAGLGDEGSLFWSHASSIGPGATATVDVYRYDIASGIASLAGGGLTVTGTFSPPAAGAWNDNPSLFSGAGFYLGVNRGGRLLYLGEDGASILSETSFSPSSPGGNNVVGFGDFEFTAHGILGTSLTGVSGEQPGIWYFDGLSDRVYLSYDYPGQIASANGSFYTIGSGDGDNGVILSKIDIFNNTSTLIGSLISTGSYQVNDMAGSNVAIPEPSSALLIGLSGALALLRRRRR